jgi:hypothetical protein
MILTTHAVVGAALATFLPSHPAAAFAVGFASHFVLDAIPHVDYPIRSRSVNPKIGAPMAFDKALLQDVVTIGSDGLFGILVSLFFFSSSANFWAVLTGAVGAMLPDPLQFAYTRHPFEPLRTLQRFHRWAHSKTKIDNIVLGISTQAAFVVLVVGRRQPFIAASSILPWPWFALPANPGRASYCHRLGKSAPLRPDHVSSRLNIWASG